MTEQEQLMYQIIGKISAANAPLVFKGALIAKLMLIDSSFESIDRPTRDIDADWTGEPPTMAELADAVNQSLGPLGSSIRAEIDREYGIGRTAGLRYVISNLAYGSFQGTNGRYNTANGVINLTNIEFEVYENYYYYYKDLSHAYSFGTDEKGYYLFIPQLERIDIDSTDTQSPDYTPKKFYKTS